MCLHGSCPHVVVMHDHACVVMHDHACVGVACQQGHALPTSSLLTKCSHYKVVCAADLVLC